MSNPEPSKTVPGFYEGLVDQFGKTLNRSLPYYAEADALAAHLVTIRAMGETTDPSGNPDLPRLSRAAIKAGDKLLISATAEGDKVVLGSVLQAGQTDELVYPFYFDANSFTNANTLSTTSTSSFADAISLTFPSMPAGTYTFTGEGGGNFSHTVASGIMESRFRLEGINSVLGTTKAVKVNNVANVECCVIYATKTTAVTVLEGDSITVYYEYRCQTAGTLSARNAHIFGLLRKV